MSNATAARLFSPRIRLVVPQFAPYLSGLISPLLLLLVWAFAASHHWLPEQILVPPAQVVAAAREVWSSGELPDDLQVSLLRLLWGFAIGSVLGIVFGALLATSQAFRAYTGPLFNILRQVPTLALTPMFILLLGIGETLKIVIIVKSTFFPVALATLEGIRQVPAAYHEVGSVYRLGLWARWRRVVFPAAAPSVLTGVRIALGRSWMVLVAVELLAADTGIGQMMEMGRQTLRLDIVMVGVIVTGVIGFVIDKGFRLLQGALMRWRVQ